MSLSSIEVPNAPSVPGETKPRIAATCPDGVMTRNLEGVNNMHDNFMNGMKHAGEDAPCFGYRPIGTDGGVEGYRWFSFKQVKETASAIGSGLSKLGINTKDCIGIFSPNRIEWSYIEHASYIYNFISVPMYDTLGIDAVKFMAEETEMTAVAIAPEKLSTFASLWKYLPHVKVAVLFGSSQETGSVEVPEGAQLISLDELVVLGSNGGLAPLPKTPASPDDPCTICYTSGTTGTPKGAILTHMCLISNVNSAGQRIAHGYIPSIDKTDTYISILPLAHCLERCIHAIITGRGGAIGFNQGDIRKVIDDIFELKPTIIVGVPRIFNRINDQVWAQVNTKGGLVGALFRYAYDVKKANLAYNSSQHWLWDRVVFKAVRQKLGGRLRLVISGSAPISGEVLDFLRITLSATVLEGYGLTETTGPCGVSLSTDMKAGNVGCSLGNCIYKLVSVPEMGYTVDDKPYPRGELYVKGNNVFAGYHKNPKLTAEAKTPDGWLITGDIGMFDAQGSLVIIDRKKNMFKLAQGEYVTPERIEIIYTSSALIDQAYIHGDSLESQLVAVIVPNEEFLRSHLAETSELAHWAAKESFADICQSVDVTNNILEFIDSWGRTNGLKGFEIPKNIHLESAPFTIENSILTPTLKVKRPAAKTMYSDTLGRLYNELKSKGLAK
ncbi:medium-chain fatty acid-CoA ligase faa2 [Coemansia sp. RSA 1813]|nr:medium-chain fatty acid-CoA ligase faa2 [Coemansia sp. RSA 1646]KAJ1771175.1 medium-chain fatty acid-CoA ligase faa2 [Coemansia sp. RSA 1843]KAJ2087801.1 medium-chain fatty acid-CoA ligase faa2 [Coemansia sp. RSA 986]KAJ2212696.1 medium-chain fatty acid-CoA ligase faa2 [Coemansia sp. RSA 487]KAJ2567380.1 medium-chain fatty acid-CoA ligase faa2 [Coemansia sp. RSA 1813]